MQNIRIGYSLTVQFDWLWKCLLKNSANKKLNDEVTKINSGAFSTSRRFLIYKQYDLL